jgi:hypothetical protein
MRFKDLKLAYSIEYFSDSYILNHFLKNLFFLGSLLNNFKMYENIIKILKNLYRKKKFYIFYLPFYKANTNVVVKKMQHNLVPILSPFRRAATTVFQELKKTTDKPKHVPSYKTLKENLIEVLEESNDIIANIRLKILKLVSDNLYLIKLRFNDTERFKKKFLWQTGHALRYCKSLLQNL